MIYFKNLKKDSKKQIDPQTYSIKAVQEIHAVMVLKLLIEFFLNRDAFCRFYRITRKQKKKKKSRRKWYPNGRWTQGLWLYYPALLLSELILPFARSLRPLDPYILMLCWFLDLEIFWINKYFAAGFSFVFSRFCKIYRIHLYLGKLNCST